MTFKFLCYGAGFPLKLDSLLCKHSIRLVSLGPAGGIPVLQLPNLPQTDCRPERKIDAVARQFSDVIVVVVVVVVKSLEAAVQLRVDVAVLLRLHLHRHQDEGGSHLLRRRLPESAHLVESQGEVAKIREQSNKYL